MKIDFSPKFQMNPLAFAQAGIGAIQGIAGFLQNKSALKGLRNLKSPTYTQSASINDFYNKALQRYSTNPYMSAGYRQQQQNAQRGLATGIGALQDRRSAIGGLPSLIQAYNDANLKAVANAEQQQGQNLAQLGQASQLKTSEQHKEFDINKMLPWQTKFGLLAAKAGGGANIMNAGLHNIMGGLQGAQEMDLMKQLYGNNSGSGGGGGYQGNGISSNDVFNNRSIFRR